MQFPGRGLPSGFRYVGETDVGCRRSPLGPLSLLTSSISLSFFPFFLLLLPRPSLLLFALSLSISRSPSLTKTRVRPLVTSGRLKNSPLCGVFKFFQPLVKKKRVAGMKIEEKARTRSTSWCVINILMSRRVFSIRVEMSTGFFSPQDPLVILFCFQSSFLSFRKYLAF